MDLNNLIKAVKEYKTKCGKDKYLNAEIDCTGKGAVFTFARNIGIGIDLNDTYSLYGYADGDNIIILDDKGGCVCV